MHSVEATIAIPRNAFEMYSLLGSANKQVSLLQGGEHVFMVDLCKAQVNQAVLDFIATVLHPAYVKPGEEGGGAALYAV